MRNKGKYYLIAILISVLLLGYKALKPTINYLSSYLSNTERVNANVLIVEGWLPDYALELAYEEFQRKGYEIIITSGLKFISDYYVLSENGYLIFHPKIKDSLSNEVSQHIIEINAFSSLNRPYSAHFNLFVNDSLIEDFFTNKRKKNYISTWRGSLTNIDSIMIQFTNDRVDDNGDLNLFVKEIIIDHKTRIQYQNNSEYNIGVLNGERRIINNFNSYAELARNKLLSMGIDSSIIFAVPGQGVRINRTMISAFALRDWLKTTNINIKGINIVSIGMHARRTLMTYNKVLNEKYKIGIVSLPDIETNNSLRNKVLKTIRETLEILYYRIILIYY
jgi:hypothetical protein